MARKFNRTQRKRGGSRMSARERKPSARATSAAKNAEAIVKIKEENKRMQLALFKAARAARIKKLEEDHAMNAANVKDDPVVAELNRLIGALGV